MMNLYIIWKSVQVNLNANIIHSAIKVLWHSNSPFLTRYLEYVCYEQKSILIKAWIRPRLCRKDMDVYLRHRKRLM